LLGGVCDGGGDDARFVLDGHCLRKRFWLALWTLDVELNCGCEVTTWKAWELKERVSFGPTPFQVPPVWSCL
jgi:hypothetical protein